jgi:MFS family permease
VERFTNRVNLLRANTDYRNLWLASLGSQFGNWFNEVALAQVTLTLTHSPVAMGFVLLCRSLPNVLLGPFVGPFVDRFPKRTILVLTDLVRAAFALSLSLSVLIHMSYILYIVSFLLGIAGILFNSAHSAVIPRIVTGEELVIANTLESQTSGLIQIIGATLGGLLSASVDPIACFAINATSYLWSAWHIQKCHWNKADSSVRTLAYTQSLKVGFNEVMRNKVIRTIVLIGIS